MNTRGITGTLARVRAAITRPTPPVATVAAQRPAAAPRAATSRNTAAGRRGIPAAAQSKRHIHAEPTITLPAPTAGTGAPAAAAGD